MAIFIGIYKDNEVVQKHELSGPLYVGRSRDNNIVIDDPRLSAVHCHISLDDSNFVEILDLDSKNGMIFKNRKVIVHKLFLDQTLKIGKHEIRLMSAAMNEKELDHYNKANHAIDDRTVLVELELEESRRVLTKIFERKSLRPDKPNSKT